MDSQEILIIAVNFMFDTNFTDYDSAAAHIKHLEYKLVSKTIELCKILNEVHHRGAEYCLAELKRL